MINYLLKHHLVKLSNYMLCFDEENKLWIAEKEFFTSSLPTNIFVDYKCNATLAIPNEEIDKLYIIF